MLLGSSKSIFILSTTPAADRYVDLAGYMSAERRSAQPTLDLTAAICLDCFSVHLLLRRRLLSDREEQPVGPMTTAERQMNRTRRLHYSPNT